MELKDLWNKYKAYLFLALFLFEFFFLYKFIQGEITQSVVLKTTIDNIIPFVPFFVLFYALFIPFILFVLIISFKNKNDLFRISFALFIGATIASIFQFLLPTEMIRPVVANTNFLNGLVNYIYSSDLPFNLFPSSHVVYTTIALFGLYATKRKFFWISLIPAVLIIASTVFIKQHFFLDIVFGVFLGLVIYFLVFYEGIIKQD